MRLAGLAAAVVSVVLASGSAGYAQSRNETITRAFMEICLSHAPSYRSDKVEAAFQQVGKKRFPAGVVALLSVVPAKSCSIVLSGIPLNPDGSSPTIPLALEKQIMTELASKVGGEVSVYRPGKPTESWSVKVGRAKHRLQSTYKKGSNRWRIVLYKQ